MPADLTNPNVRNTELEPLHPVVRTAVKRVLADLAKVKIPLFVFEAFRSPVRQNFLFAQGRTAPGPIVTKAEAWQSYHQYGLAVDLVFHGPGKWKWEEPKKGMWKRMHEIAGKHGLMPLSFETPHVQLIGTSTDALMNGRYPDGGDESWAINLSAAIVAWNATPPAPSLPRVLDRPPLA